MSESTVKALVELAEALQGVKRQYGEAGSRDVDIASWNARIDRALAALSHPPQPADGEASLRKIAMLILRNDRAEAVKWAKGLVLDESGSITIDEDSAPPPPMGGEPVAEVYSISGMSADEDAYATIRLLHRATDQWGLRVRAGDKLYTHPASPTPSASAAVGEWVSVPKEPTREMVSNALKNCGGIGAGSCGEHTGVDGDDMREVWESMLAAAPQAQEGGQR